jgi:hypothetical protein
VHKWIENEILLKMLDVTYVHHTKYHGVIRKWVPRGYAKLVVTDSV